MSETAPVDVDEYLYTTIRSPNLKWYEVLPNDDSQGTVYLSAIDNEPDQVISFDELAKRMAKNWSTVYEGVTEDPADRPGGESA